MLMSCQRYVLLVTVVLTLLGMNSWETAAASEEKDYASLSFPPSDRPLKIRSTHPVVTHHKNAIPLDDTFCVCDETGQALMCSGVENPTHIQCLPEKQAVLEIHPEALTTVNNTLVQCPLRTGAGNSANESELEITGVSSHQQKEMNPKTLCTVNLHDLATIAIKREPLDPDTELSLPCVVPLPKKTRKGVCPGCQQDFLTASKLKNHRKTTKEAACKAGLNTTCACGTSFETVRLLESHRQTSKEAACKAGLNTTCACGTSFETVSLLISHRQTSKPRRPAKPG